MQSGKARLNTDSRNSFANVGAIVGASVDELRALKIGVCLVRQTSDKRP